MAKTAYIETLIKPSAEMAGLISEAREKVELLYSNTSIAQMQTLPSSLGEFDMSMDSILHSKPSVAKKILLDKLIEANTLLEAKLNEEFRSIPDKLTKASISLLFTVLNTLNAVLIAPYDDIILEVQITYNMIVRLVKKLINLKDEEERKNLERRVLTELEHIAMSFPLINDIIALIVLIDMMKTLIPVLKDIKGSSPELYDDAIGKCKRINDFFSKAIFISSQIAQIVLYAFGIIMKLLSLFGAAFNSSKEFDAKMNEENAKAEKSDNSIPQMRDTSNDNKNSVKFYAINNIHNFSYNFKTPLTQDPAPKEPNILDGCFPPTELDYMNLCSSTNVGSISEEAINALISPNKFIYEIEDIDNYSLMISNNQNINKGDIIGYVGTLPIKANTDGIVENIEDNIIFCKNIEKSEEETLSQIEELSKIDLDNLSSELTDMTDKFSDLSNAEKVLMDYIPYALIPQIPLNISIEEKNNKQSKNTIIKTCENAADDMIKTYQDNIQELAGKTHVESMIQNDKLIELKNGIIAEKNRFFDNVFNFYDHYLTRNNLVSEENKNDFLLYSNYMNLYSKIEYDKDNKYVLELLRILTDFISTRYIIESESLSTAIDDLNEICDDVLKQKWSEKQPYIKSLYSAITTSKNLNHYDYYAQFEKIFKTNFYNLDSSDTNEDINSEYKNMYNFLVGIADANDETETPTTDISTDDINAMINGGGKNEDKKIDTTKAKVRQKIKEICNRYAIIKNVKDYKSIYGKNYTAKATKEELIKQASYEYEILENYYLKLKNIYIDNASLYNDDAFDKFKEANIETCPIVYYKNEKYNHYLIKTKTDNIEDLYNDENKKKLDAVVNYMSSPYTKVQNNDLKYWLLYCGQATLMHCIMPMYWSCGLIVAGAPIPMPVIYVPIYFLKGTFSMLFGLGICGIAIWPMILCVNFSLDTKTILAPINTILDKIKELSGEMITVGKNALNKSLEEQIYKISKNAENYDRELLQIDSDILDVRHQLTVNKGLIKIQIEKEKEKLKQQKNKKRGEI